MKNHHLQELIDRLKPHNYKVIEEELETQSSEMLVALLDANSVKVADTAATLLRRRKEISLLIDACVNNRIRSARGRVRCMFVFDCSGIATPETVTAYLHLLGDRSADVVSEALFGLVFMRRRDLLPILREHLEHLPAGSPRCEDFSKAIRALEANDPSLFSPGFFDAGNVWRLDEPAPPYGPGEL